MSLPRDKARRAVNRIPRVAAGMGFDAEGPPKTNDLVTRRGTSTPFGDRGVLAQVLRENLWVTNDTVMAAAFSNNVLYLGGLFTQVGPATGGFAALDLDSGTPLQPYPLVVGEVRAVASDGSGGWYIGGHFTAVRGQPRHHLAHLDASGNLTAWDPNPDSEIRALVVSGSTVYVGGTFTSIGGQLRNHIAALDATTGAPTSWNPHADYQVNALAVRGSGPFLDDPVTVYAGGDFTNIAGQPRNFIAALDATTGAATSWDPNANSPVEALAVSGNTVYAGGDFTSIGGQLRNHIAALDVASGAVTSWDPNANYQVLTLLVNGNTLYAGGGFTSVLGETRWGIAGLDAIPSFV